MKSLRIPASALWATLAVLATLFNLFVLHVPGFNALKIIAGFGWLMVLPGYLVTRILKLKFNSFWESLCFYVGLSLLSVMLVALITNTILPHFGDHQPLATGSLLVSTYIGWLGLAIASVWRNPAIGLELRMPRVSGPGLLVGLTGLICTALSVFGAIYLNNGGTGLITWLMLALVVGGLGVLAAKRNKLSETTTLTGLYFASLSLLLMTSMRGWFITGHDVQNEFHVFSITLAHLDWNMANFQDAYNACLSITILPTVVNRIMGVPELYVFKTVFQALFALTPVLVYLIARRFADRLVALLAAIYFIAFPTYFTDMPMLNRQEVAFVFMGLILYTTFSEVWTMAQRRWLIALLGLGVILSHYTTTYVMLVMFGFVVAARYVISGYHKSLLAVLKRLPQKIWMQRLRRASLRELRRKIPVTITVEVLAGLLVATFVWSVWLTNTGGNLADVLGQTVSSIDHGLSSDSKSSDTSYSIFGGSKETDQQRLDQYVSQTVPELRAGVAPDDRYSLLSTAVQAVEPSNMALTTIGSLLSSVHFPVVTFNDLVRQGSAVFLQLALLVGVALVFVSKKLRKTLSREYRLFQLTSPFLLATVVILPVLSAQYGLLRAFQQSLMLSGVVIVWATLLLVPARFKRMRVWVATGLALGFLASSTGMITTLLGGYPAQLQLANSGSYYDLYYVHGTEVAAADWLANEIGTTKPATIYASVPATGYILNQLSQQSNVSIPDEGVYPSIIPQDAFVFLGYTATVDDEATIYSDGNLITYRFPTSFLDTHKDLIYANNGARIYR